MEADSLVTTWLAGELPANADFWGLQILWWGRLGKALQFVSALVILIDIIGVEVLRERGRAMFRLVEMDALTSVSRTFRRVVSSILVRWELHTLNEEPEFIVESIGEGFAGRPLVARTIPNPKAWQNPQIRARREQLSSRLSELRISKGWGALVFLTGLPGPILLHLAAFTTAPLLPVEFKWVAFFAWFGFAIPSFYMSSLILVVFFMITVRILAVFIYLLLVVPLAKLLSSARLKPIALTVSLVTFAIGFAMDFLAS